MRLQTKEHLLESKSKNQHFDTKIFNFQIPEILKIKFLSSPKLTITTGKSCSSEIIMLHMRISDRNYSNILTTNKASAIRMSMRQNINTFFFEAT